MDFAMVIGGERSDGVGQIDVVDPSSEEVFATAPRADAALAEAAVAAAKQAFLAWAALGFPARRAMIEAIADAMEGRFDEFVRLLTREQGKPTPEAQFEIGGSIAALRAFAKMDTPLETIRQTATDRIVQQRTPLGVVVAITPWNFPMLLLMMKVGPALITGNTVIAKPAPTTPLTTLLFGEIAREILPSGVLSTIVDLNDLGAFLTEHPDVAKVSFTGSTATGKRVMQSAAGTLKRLTLELGGNDAAILLDDADIAIVAPQIFQAAMLNAGQVCLAAKRVYAPTALYDELCDALAKLASDAIVDDGSKQGTQIGPLQNRQQYDKVLEFVADGHNSGTVIAGGAALDRPGYFIAPTIVRNIPDDARLVREEQFGPVLPVLAYDDIDDVVRRANDSDHGLGGTIWTADSERGLAVALRIETGTVWVNKHLDLPFDVPFGGAKQSGIGSELGQDGLEEFTQAKIINMAL